MKYKPALLFVCLFLSACGASVSDGGDYVILSFENLQPLQDGFHYEGWIIVDDNRISTGKFNVSENGALTSLTGIPIGDSRFEVSHELNNASDFILTIEPAGDTDADPSDTHLLSGSFDEIRATLSMSHSSSFGNDFSEVSGSYILATPTDGENDTEKSGVWFLDPEGGAPTASLNLPDLPVGWKYEGWAVYNGTPVSTGTFTTVSGPDDEAPYSGPQTAPPFPGEDFLMHPPSGLTFPLDLSGGKVVISIEPNPDDSPSPFVLKPLVGDIPDPAEDHVSYNLSSNTDSFVSGSALIN
ncbi:MAG: anti-sigma factor [Balneolaceae bacterium]|nr:anti-sigma factor [Balneolaceae bacterium]